MSTSVLSDNPTELHLDYSDISSGQLVIVIDGLPSGLGHAFAASTATPRMTSASGPNGNGRHGARTSPLVEEARAINAATAYTPVLATSLLLAAWRGQEPRALELIAAAIEDAAPEDERRAAAVADYASAVLYNGLGRYGDALAAAERACVHEGLGTFAWALLELVEAGARSNDRGVATEALGRLEERASSGTDWLLGVRARSAALLSEGEHAERLYAEAIELLDRSGVAVHLARARLVYGEWLRRRSRRFEARTQLRAAHEAFSSVGAEAFAERARRELLATGESARKRTDETRDILTPQEAQIAVLAREGYSNPEIGAQLFISPRTVQYHLRKVFRKLDITSRSHLSRVPAGLIVPGDSAAPE